MSNRKLLKTTNFDEIEFKKFFLFNLSGKPKVNYFGRKGIKCFDVMSLVKCIYLIRGVLA